jgi:hypothetical protein
MMNETDELRKNSGNLAQVRGSNSTGRVPKAHLGPRPLEILLKETIQPAQEVQKEIDRVSPTDPYFSRAEKLHQNYNLPRKSFENFRKLLCGFAHSHVFCFRIQKMTFWNTTRWWQRPKLYTGLKKSFKGSE